MSLRALYDVPAPAKLNLFLHVVGRRQDGYHLLQSPFVLLDWADRLHFECRSDGRLQRQDLGTTLPPDDLCLRAARALQSASGTPLGATILIEKHLPAGAGMGGGSSDAASTLLALNRLWQLDWPRARLMALALPLGADVPFFVGGDNAFVEGIGDQLTPIDLSPANYVVVKPTASLPTAEIFSHPHMVRDTEAVILLGFPETASRNIAAAAFDGKGRGQVWQPGHGEFGRNDLQPPAEDRCPEVAQAAHWLRSRFGNSRMTGSGSAVFSRVDEQGSTDLALRSMPASWQGRTCRSLVQHPLKGWAG